jgi:zinc protease
MMILMLLSVPLATADSIGEPDIWSLDEATTVVLVEDHRAPLVELRVQVPAGDWTPWFQDNHGEEAWTLQHYDPDGDLRARADALAIDLSMYTRQQRSVLSVSCLKQDLPAAVELVGDIFANTAYDEAELRRAQKGIRIGWDGNLKDPDFRLNQRKAALLFDEEDARRYSFIKPDDIETDGAVLAATRDTMLRLPGRIIGLAGDVSREEAEETIQDLLPEAGALPEGMAPVFKPLLQRPLEYVESMANLTQVYFAYLREGPTWDDDDYVAWLVADHTLGGHFYSRLYVSLRHEGGETYGAYTTGSGAGSPEAYALSTFTRTENKATTQDKLQQTLATFHADGITEEELADAVGYMSGRRLRMRQAPGQVLNETLWALSNDHPIDWEVQLVEAARSLTVESVNASIQVFFDPEKFTMLTVEPE